ncbi:hypothetical protein [Streptosporangium sp. V21-05]|uniref:hypothetical protein n=1 Tax=Streptosporangium sp. V21-05 TaxID=3446115 RepID=UPI003F535372
MKQDEWALRLDWDVTRFGARRVYRDRRFYGIGLNNPLPPVYVVNSREMENDDHFAAAAAAITKELDSLFRRLGPPPDHLGTRHDFMTTGGGDAGATG